MAKKLTLVEAAESIGISARSMRLRPGRMSDMGMMDCSTGGGGNPVPDACLKLVELVYLSFTRKSIRILTCHFHEKLRELAEALAVLRQH